MGVLLKKINSTPFTASRRGLGSGAKWSSLFDNCPFIKLYKSSIHGKLFCPIIILKRKANPASVNSVVQYSVRQLNPLETYIKIYHLSIEPVPLRQEQ